MTTLLDHLPSADLIRPLSGEEFAQWLEVEAQLEWQSKALPNPEEGETPQVPILTPPPPAQEPPKQSVEPNKPIPPPVPPRASGAKLEPVNPTPTQSPLRSKVTDSPQGPTKQPSLPEPPKQAPPPTSKQPDPSPVSTREPLIPTTQDLATPGYDRSGIQEKLRKLKEKQAGMGTPPPQTPPTDPETPTPQEERHPDHFHPHGGVRMNREVLESAQQFATGQMDAGKFGAILDRYMESGASPTGGVILSLSQAMRGYPTTGSHQWIKDYQDQADIQKWHPINVPTNQFLETAALNNNIITSPIIPFAKAADVPAQGDEIYAHDANGDIVALLTIPFGGVTAEQTGYRVEYVVTPVFEGEQIHRPESVDAYNLGVNSSQQLQQLKEAWQRASWWPHPLEDFPTTSQEAQGIIDRINSDLDEDQIDLGLGLAEQIRDYLQTIENINEVDKRYFRLGQRQVDNYDPRHPVPGMLPENVTEQQILDQWANRAAPKVQPLLEESFESMGARDALNFRNPTDTYGLTNVSRRNAQGYLDNAAAHTFLDDFYPQWQRYIEQGNEPTEETFQKMFQEHLASIFPVNEHPSIAFNNFLANTFPISRRYGLAHVDNPADERIIREHPLDIAKLPKAFYETALALKDASPTNVRSVVSRAYNNLGHDPFHEMLKHSRSLSTRTEGADAALLRGAREILWRKEMFDNLPKAVQAAALSIPDDTMGQSWLTRFITEKAATDAKLDEEIQTLGLRSGERRNEPVGNYADIVGMVVKDALHTAPVVRALNSYLQPTDALPGDEESNVLPMMGGDKSYFSVQQDPEDPERFNIHVGDASIGGMNLSTASSQSMEKNTATRMFPNAPIEGDDSFSRIHGVEIQDDFKGQGYGQLLYLGAMINNGANWFYNSQSSEDATNVYKAAAKKGWLEVYWRGREPGWNEEGGVHLVRVTDLGWEAYKAAMQGTPYSNLPTKDNPRGEVSPILGAEPHQATAPQVQQPSDAPYESQYAHAKTPGAIKARNELSSEMFYELDKHERLTKDQKKLYRSEMEHVLRNMPEKALGEIKGNLGKVNWMESTEAVSDQFNKLAGQVLNKEGFPVKYTDIIGCVNREYGDIYIDGGKTKQRIRGETTSHVRGGYAHELGHILDKGEKYSKDPEFREACEEEIFNAKGVVLSEYARSTWDVDGNKVRQHPKEVFAELVRAFYGSDVDKARIQAKAPKLYNLFTNKWGLWGDAPQTATSSQNASVLERETGVAPMMGRMGEAASKHVRNQMKQYNELFDERAKDLLDNAPDEKTKNSIQSKIGSDWTGEMIAALKKAGVHDESDIEDIIQENVVKWLFEEDKLFGGYDPTTGAEFKGRWGNFVKYAALEAVRNMRKQKERFSTNADISSGGTWLDAIEDESQVVGATSSEPQEFTDEQREQVQKIMQQKEAAKGSRANYIKLGGDPEKGRWEFYKERVANFAKARPNSTYYDIAKGTRHQSTFPGLNAEEIRKMVEELGIEGIQEDRGAPDRKTTSDEDKVILAVEKMIKEGKDINPGSVNVRLRSSKAGRHFKVEDVAKIMGTISSEGKLSRELTKQELERPKRSKGRQFTRSNQPSDRKIFTSDYQPRWRENRPLPQPPTV